MAGRDFNIVRELARDELDRHQRRIIGVTTSVPMYIDEGDTDTDAFMQWVCDVRIDVRQYGGVDFEGFSPSSTELVDPQWGLIKNVVISQWAVGAVADMGIPVLMERDEAGQISIIARSNIMLPDIVYKTHSYHELGLTFMRFLEVDTDGTYTDGFGYEVPDPTTETGITRTYLWDAELTRFNSTDFLWDSTPLNSNNPGWVRAD